MAYKLPNIESFYTGTYTQEPGESYGDFFTGYRLDFGRIGAPTSPQTANQISEVTSRLSEGTKVIELQPLQGETFETIPRQQFTEVKQLMKITGATPTLHAPLIDPAGFTREGWTDYSREQSEREIMNAVCRAHDMDIKGNIPVTLHASGGVPSYDPMPGTDPDVSGDSKKVVPKKSVLYVVDRESGQLGPIKREIISSPIPLYRRDEKGNLYHDESGSLVEDPRAKPIKENGVTKYEVTPEFRLDELNRQQWFGELSNLEYNQAIIERNVGQFAKVAGLLHSYENAGIELTEQQKTDFLEAKKEMRSVGNLLNDYDLKLRGLFSDAQRFGSKETIKVLNEARENYTQKMKELEELRKVNGRYVDFNEIAEKDPRTFAKIIESRGDIEKNMINKLRQVEVRKLVSTEEFALEKTKQTISNVAMMAFKKFGEKAPVISLENFFPNTAFSRADSMKKLVEASRAEFVKKAKEEGYNEDNAKEIAKKLIGVTWDTGHINLIRKYGFGDDKNGNFDAKKFGKFMAEEAKTIAPYVKHVHLADNFGYNETHLPPGMGEVPFKEILRELEKAGYSGKNIVEAGNFVAQKMGLPTPYVLEAFGSPLYGAQVSPYWNAMKQTSGYPGAYFSGYGMMLPEQHFSTYGSGFATLPSELGGQIPGKGQRFSGAPME